MRLLRALVLAGLLTQAPVAGLECVIFDWAVPPDGRWTGAGSPGPVPNLMSETTRWVFYLDNCSVVSGVCDAFGSGSVAYQDGVERTQWYGTGTVPQITVDTNSVTYSFSVVDAPVPLIGPRFEDVDWMLQAELPTAPADSPSAGDLEAAVTIDASITQAIDDGLFPVSRTGTATDTVFDSCTPAPAALTIDDVTQAEGSGGGTTPFVFTVSRDIDADEVQVTVQTADSSALAGSDYTAITPTVLTFPAAGTLTQTVTVHVAADDVVELDEGFTVELSSPVNATLADGIGAGSIQNDDAATVSVDSGEIVEGSGGGTTPFTFTVTLDAAVDTAVSVSFDTADGTAEDENGDADYTATQGMLTFDGDAGEVETVAVDITADERPERDETFFVDLFGLGAGGRAVTLDVAQGEATILDDDDACPGLDVYRQPFDSPSSVTGHPATSGGTTTFENVVGVGGGTTSLPAGPVSGLRVWGFGRDGPLPCALDAAVPFDVIFSADDAGVPGAIVAQRNGIPGEHTDVGSGVVQIDLLFAPFDGAGAGWISVERAEVGGCAFEWLAEEATATYDDQVFVTSGLVPDDVYLCVGDPPFFADGFESGDTARWSSAAN